MKKIVTLALILSLLFLSACAGSNYPSTTDNETTAGKDVVYKDYPGDTGIKLDHANTNLPANIFTTTGAENGLAGTLYAIEGKVIECNTSEIYPYFIVSTDGGNIWISDVSKKTATGGSPANGLTIDLDILKSFYPFPETGEDVRVVAQYQGMSGTTNYPTFIYCGSDYLTTALLRSASVSTNPDKITGSFKVGNYTMTLPDGYTAEANSNHSYFITSDDGSCSMAIYALDVSLLDEAHVQEYIASQEGVFQDDDCTIYGKKSTQVNFAGTSMDMLIYVEADKSGYATLNIEGTFTDSWYGYTVFLQYPVGTDKASDYASAFGEFCSTAEYTGKTPRFDFVQ